jgi:hypothetical protein
MGVAASCHTPPLAAGLDSGVIPDREGLIAGEWSQHDLDSRQPFGIRMTRADEYHGCALGQSMEYLHPSQRNSG